jgi:hypothetical protein
MFGELIPGRKHIALFLGLAVAVLIAMPQLANGGISCTLSGPGAGEGNTIICGQPVTFNIRLTNDIGENITAFNHGFRLYSYAWNNVAYDLPVYDTAGGLDDFNALYAGTSGFSVDGLDDDTISVTGLYVSGLPSWYDDVILTITTQFDCPYIYRTIYIDSCSIPIPGGEWIWKYNNNSQSITPTWDGPHSFEIVGPDDGMWWAEPFMRDFDQHRNSNWHNYCGPAAATNLVWWFDLKYPAWDIIEPGLGDVSAYVLGNLAEMMSTNNPLPGTPIKQLRIGIWEYLAERGLAGKFVADLHEQPSFGFCRNELLAGRGVILLLGFWRCIEVIEIGDGCYVVKWERLGGHYVTVAGVDAEGFGVAISDPDRDAAETVLPCPPSRVIGTFHNHPVDHTWGESASHDAFNVTIPPALGVDAAQWELTDYWDLNNMVIPDDSDLNVGYTADTIEDHYWCDTVYDAFTNGKIYTEVEAAYIIGPRTGDVNSDGSVNVGDPVFLINYIFKGGPAPENPQECDPNCDDNVNVGDAVYLINYIFRGGPEPCRL